MWVVVGLVVLLLLGDWLLVCGLFGVVGLVCLVVVVVYLVFWFMCGWLLVLGFDFILIFCGVLFIWYVWM